MNNDLIRNALQEASRALTELDPLAEKHDAKLIDNAMKEFKAATTNTVVPPELALKYELHPDVLKLVEDGTLEFIHEAGERVPEHGTRSTKLVFAVPALRDHDSDAFLNWHGPDPKTWDLEGIRFRVDREYDDAGDQDLFTPESDRSYEYNVDELVEWLKSQVK